MTITAVDQLKDTDISPFEAGKTYQIPTLYGSYEAARILMEYLEKEELKEWSKLSESSYAFWDNQKDAAYDFL